MNLLSPVLRCCAELVNLEALAPSNQILVTSPRKPWNSSMSIRFSRTASRFRICAKRSHFQDFQGYAKPLHLEKATEVEVCTKSSLERMLSSLKGGESQAVFKVDISTSKLYGSSLSDLNAGILLSLIDEKGNSILQRIPANLMIDHSTEMDIPDCPEILSFQRGSFDEFVFKGPKLGRLEAIWLSVESGQWRLGSLSLTVIYWCGPSVQKTDGKEPQSVGGIRFEFPAEDVLLGEGTDNSMVELRPCIVSDLSGVEALAIAIGRSSNPNSVTMDSISNAESMREYSDLKFSLLLYDAVLISTGMSVAFFTVGESAGFAFLAGGVLGFLYLLLLQRSVDELPAPMAISETSEKEDRPLGSFKGPLPTLALAIGFAIFAVEYNWGDSDVIVTPKEMVMGMLGFLACKVAVVLAAVKPMAFVQKMNK